VAGNTAGNLTGFDTTATATATWLLLALMAGLQTAEVKERHPGMAPPVARPRWMRTARLLAAGLVLGSTGLAIVQWNLRPLVADVAARTSERNASAGTWTAAIQTGKQAVALWPDEPAHHLTLSWAYLQGSAAGSGDPIQWLQRAESELQAACALRPGDYQLWAALGELYARWGSRGDASKLLLAQEAYRQASELAPNLATLYTARGMIDMALGDLDQAAIRFRRAVDRDATDAWAFTHLGDAELARGQVGLALAAYEQAVHWEPALLAAYVGQAHCYWQQGQAQMARTILARVLQVDPSNSSALVLYQEISGQP
jgi:tetratricopeptide (TPR) repeat protein